MRKKSASILFIVAFSLAAVCGAGKSFAGDSPLGTASSAAAEAAIPPAEPVPAQGGDDPLAWGNNGDAAPSAPAADAVTPAATPSAPVAIVPADSAEQEAPALQKNENLLQDKIDALEKRLSAVEGDIQQLQQRKEVTAERSLEEKPVVKPVKKRKVARKKSAPAHQWVLKAAKPGMGWVSSKGSGELRSVSIGDQLPGIGKVTAIVKDSAGQWSIHGTSGRISQ